MAAWAAGGPPAANNTATRTLRDRQRAQAVGRNVLPPSGTRWRNSVLRRTPFPAALVGTPRARRWNSADRLLRKPITASPAAARAPRTATSRRAAEQCDELAPPHSITSSAIVSSVVGHLEAEGFGGLEVEHELELRRLQHRQIGRLGALENAARLTRSPRSAPQ